MLTAAAILCACSSTTFAPTAARHVPPPRITRIAATARTWDLHAHATALAWLTLFRDGAPFEQANLAVAYSIQRSNPRIAPFDAVHLASVGIAAANENALDPEFFCATMLQESAFDPDAISSAGAVGIAQFTIGTADAEGVNPFNSESALRGAAALLGDYVNHYRGVYADPYAAALAAYNAGPQAVASYRGVPPYAETQAYIGYVYERWARIITDEVMRKRV